MNTYAIFTDDGYGLQRLGMVANSYIVAETPQQARKAFLARHKGTHYATPDQIRATKVEDFPIDDPDQIAADWLPGGKFYKG